jgi:hypothetical protein
MAESHPSIKRKKTYSISVTSFVIFFPSRNTFPNEVNGKGVLLKSEQSLASLVCEEKLAGRKAAIMLRYYHSHTAK